MFVVVKIENSLLKLLYLAAFAYVSLKTSAADKNRFKVLVYFSSSKQPEPCTIHFVMYYQNSELRGAAATVYCTSISNGKRGNSKLAKTLWRIRES